WGLWLAERAPWLGLYGQFLYSQPKTDTNYQQNATGNLLQLNPLLLYTSQSFFLSSTAKLPHTAASYGAEMRPASRLRIITNWLADRLHNAGSAASTQISAISTSTQQALESLKSELVYNYNKVEMNVLYELSLNII